MKKTLKKEVKNKGYELIYPDKEPLERVISSTSVASLQKLKTFGGAKGWENMLISGDNLPVLKTLIEMKEAGGIKNSDDTRGVRLIYIDPPFSTRLEFRGSKDQKAYDDKISGAEFLEFLRKRIILMRELLSEDGSIFVHLDWKKAHYVKAIMDEVFGEENFLNDIIWNYGGRGAKAIAGQFSRNHDIILWYRKKSHIFNQMIVEKRIKKGEAGYKKDEDGRWFKTSPRGDYTDESIEALKKEGRIYKTKNGTIRIKYFLREEGGYIIEDRLVGDVWDDIPDAMHLGMAEKTGYPTQKPEALLSRIIKAATKKGDIVLDAFSGAGTTLTVAEKLGRRWIGVDSGRLSIHTIEKRLLAIGDTKDLEDPKKKHSKPSSPFALYEAEACGCGCTGHDHAPKVKSEYYIDEDKNECVVKIFRFSSVIDGKRTRFKNLETLSSVMIDFNFNGEVFNFGRFYSSDELKEKNYEIRIPLDEIKGDIMVVYSDIFGHERWFLGEMG